MFDIVEYLNKYIDKKRVGEQIDAKGHLVFKQSLKPHSLYKAYKDLKYELFFVNNISKYRVITINNCVRIVDNNADKKEIDVMNNNFTYMLFDLIKSDLFNKIIDGTYKDDEL